MNREGMLCLWLAEDITDPGIDRPYQEVEKQEMLIIAKFHLVFTC